jgi:2-keto-3-deoxy-L-rhamnonate aldolase RhmA
MPIFPNPALQRLRKGEVALGFGLTHLRSVAAPMLAKAAGYDWMLVDMEHGAFSVSETSQLCLAALPVGITPIVRVCTGALDEGTRILDNGAHGIVVPHMNTPAIAKEVAAAFRFVPQGHRSWGGGTAVYGFQGPGMAEAQAEINANIMVGGAIETEEAVRNVEAIAATPGIDFLLIGTSDLTADMGISGQIGHQRVQDAYRKVIEACKTHGKFSGFGGVYEEQWLKVYAEMGATMIYGGNDQAFLMTGATQRARFLRDVTKR